ncbi:MAG: hypothetical protein WB615_16140 [Candidatus Tumulicola sp.]
MLAALMLAAAVSTPATRLLLEPWTGANLAVAASVAAKYRLRVVGAPNARLELRADGVAKGWIAAFCTPTVCAPTHVDVKLPQTGYAVYQFELIREDTSAPTRSGARITTNDGASVTVSPKAVVIGPSY